MPFVSGSPGNKTYYYPGGKTYHQGKKRKARRTPTITTVTSSGHVSSTGPGAAKATKQAKASRRRVRRIEKATARAEATQRALDSIGSIHTGTRHVTPINEASHWLHETVDPIVKPITTPLGHALDPNRHGALGAAVGTMQLATGGEVAAPLKAASLATDAPTAAKAAKAGEKFVTKLKAAPAKTAERIKTAPARTAERVKTAPARTARRIKETPKRIKEAPAKAKRTVTTAEGRKAAAKSAARHPVRTGYGAAAVSPVPLPGDLDKRARSFAKGNLAALTHPGKYAETSLRALPGFVTVPVGLAVEGGITAGRAASTAAHAAGVPGADAYTSHEITAPISGEVKKQVAGAKDFVGKEFSKNPKVVEKAALKDYGATPFVAALPVGKAVSKYVTKGRVRRAVRIAAERVRERSGKEHGTPDARLLENKRQRGETAKSVAKARTATRNETAARAKRARKEGQQAGGVKKLREVPKGKRGTRDVSIHNADLLNLLIRKGIDPRSPHAAERLAEVKKALKDPKEIGHELPLQTIHTRDALDHALADPKGVLGNAHLLAAYDAYKAQAKHARETPTLSLDHSERARLSSVAVTHNVPLPEELHPAGVRDIVRTAPQHGVLSRDTLKREAHRDRLAAGKLRRKAAKHTSDAKAMRRELAVRERKGSNLRLDPAVVTSRIAKAETNARNLRARASQLEEHAALKTKARYNENAILSGKARPDALRQGEFERAINKVISEKPGLVQPEYTPTGVAGGLNVTTGSNFSRLPGKSKFRSTTADEYGLVNEGLYQLLDAGVAKPVARRHIYAAVREIGNAARVKLGGRTRFKIKEADAIMRGERRDLGYVNPRTHVQVPVQTIKRVEDILQGSDTRLAENPVEYGQAIAELRDIISQQGKNLKEMPEMKGREVEIWQRARAQELEAQLEHHVGDITRQVMHFNRATSFLILGTSPAWAALQIPAEYGQAALQHGRLLNPVWVTRALREFKAMPMHKRQALEAVTGTVHRVVESEHDLQIGLRVAEGEVATAYGVFHRTPLGRLVRAIPNTLRAIDTFKGGQIRMLTAAAKIDEMSGPFNRYLKGLGGLDHNMREYLVATKGMSRQERYQYVADHPDWANRVGHNVDASLGNWVALSSKERPAALAMIFYSFVRMSMRWVFNDFPKNHPVRAAVSYYLGQQNAREVQKLLHGDPSFFSQFGIVPIHGIGPGGKPVLMDLSRIAPGSNALIEAFGGKIEGPLGTVALRTVQPVLGAGVTAGFGINPLTGKQEPHSGTQAANELLSLSPLARTAERYLLPAGAKRASGQVKLFGSTERQDALDKLFQKMKGSSTEQTIRTLGMPALPQPVARQRDVAHLGRILGQLEANSTNKRHDRAIELADTNEPTAKAAQQVKAMKAAYDEANSQLDAMFKKYGVSHKAEDKRFLQRFGDIYYGSPKKASRSAGSAPAFGPAGSSSSSSPPSFGPAAGSSSASRGPSF